VQNSYGGPTGLKEFVNACHRHQMATVLDVVYNHLGPEGNYLGEFGPYFTDIYKTPWGEAINFDGAQSDEVRRYFIDNALQWIGDFHIDALRLDAIHAIVDPSARPFVQQLRDECHQKALDLNRHIHVIAESNRNDRKVVSAPAVGGWGLDAMWNDDFHHSLRVSLTGETDGYYEDFLGIEHMGQAFRDGFVYTGQYSKFRQRHYGNSSRDIPGERLVVFSQNHDQVGNRKSGDRLGAVASFEQLKLAAGTVLLSPYLPLLFMGEEYGETAPFLYFVDHGDPMLIEAVRKGRREEFASFQWTGDLPDPQGEDTFLRSKLDWTLREGGRHRLLWTFYQEVLRLRRSLPALAHLDKSALEVSVFTDAKTVCARRWAQESQVLLVLHFSQEKKQLTVPLVRGHWRKSLDSSERRWGGLRNNTQETWEGPGEVQLTLDPWSFQLLAASSEENPV
jgi:maltooligosyltrehalose trehalohydrolase